MSSITNIGKCKTKMSPDGWARFCQHKKTDPLAPFDPATCTNDEEIMLTKQDLLSYEYRSDLKISELKQTGAEAVMRLEIAQTWFDWVNNMGSKARYQFRDGDCDMGKAIVGYLIQACTENPGGFARAFEPIFGTELINPLTLCGEGALINLESNGISDDWEIFLQWREDGYVVVGENLRQPQDARFRAKEAIRLLDTITGGQAQAPGIANEAALVQAMYEQDRWVDKPECN